MARFSVLRQIQSLDPERDHQRIVFLSKSYDFAFDTTRALEFALYRTYCVPSISALLDRTGEFRLRPQKRYDDTDLIVSTLMEWGYDSEQGRAALRRMNQIHGRFEIANDDLLYVLSTFVFEPIRWNARFGWRPLCDQERQAYFLFWHEVGWRMNIREIPATYESFERFNVDYERVHFRFSETNRASAGDSRPVPRLVSRTSPPDDSAGDLRDDGRHPDRCVRLPATLARGQRDRHGRPEASSLGSFGAPLVAGLTCGPSHGRGATPRGIGSKTLAHRSRLRDPKVGRARPRRDFSGPANGSRRAWFRGHHKLGSGDTIPNCLCELREIRIGLAFRGGFAGWVDRGGCPPRSTRPTRLVDRRG